MTSSQVSLSKTTKRTIEPHKRMNTLCKGVTQLALPMLSTYQGHSKTIIEYEFVMKSYGRSEVERWGASMFLICFCGCLSLLRSSFRDAMKWWK
jgi:hypothetical protein